MRETGGSNLRALLVDDDPDDIVVVEELLRARRGDSVSIEHAPGFHEALGCLERDRYDVVLVDHRLGPESGIELVREARRRGYPAPILLLTGMTGREIEDEALAAGVSDFVSKHTLSPDLLDRTLRYALERQRTQDVMRQLNIELEARVAARTAELERVNAALRAEIAERARIERNLRLTEERFRLAMREATGLVFEWDLQTGEVLRSDGLFELVGFSPSEIPRTIEWWRSRLHPDDLAAHEPRVAEALTSGATHIESEYRVLHRNGQWVDVWERAGVLRDEHGVAMRVIGSSTDISVRKRTEAALRESEQRFRQLAEAMPQIVWKTDPAGRITYANHRWLEYFGTAPEVGHGLETAAHVLHPDDREPTLERWNAAIANGTLFECELRMRSAGGSDRWFLARAVPIRDMAGTVLRWFATATDIHDQKAAQEELREADRRKDQFLATLAHELRNPLAPIRTGLEVLRRGERGHEEGELLARMDGQLRHMVRLIDDLLDLSRISRGQVQLKREHVDLAHVLRDAIEACAPLLAARGHEVRAVLPSHPVQVDADPVRLAQVVSNLLDNAAKFTPPHGRITLSATTGAADGPEPQWLVISVEDDGAGISGALLPRVFDQFVQGTGAPPDSGLGLGLAVVKHVAQLHGGTATARSEGPGRGSVFEVRLPIVMPGHVPPVPAAAVATPHHTTGSRVLVVDDNRDAADALALLLRIHGYRPVVAYDGEEALKEASANPPEIALVDLGLPRINGYEVARRFRAQPALAHALLVALTGFGRDSDRARALDAGFQVHLVKPVSPDDLFAALGAFARAGGHGGVGVKRLA